MAAVDAQQRPASIGPARSRDTNATRQEPLAVPTSKRVAKKASKGLKSGKTTKAQKSIDASALAQTKKKAKAKKRK